MTEQTRTSHFFIVSKLNLACVLTLAGACAAVFAMGLSVTGELELALVALIVAGLADLFDGVVARRLQMDSFQKEFGVQLDTTVDVLSFVAAPVVIVLAAAPLSFLTVLASLWFAVAGVLRLSHFNAQNVSGTGSSTHHAGLPVTYAALIFPLAFLLQIKFAGPVFEIALPLTLIATGLLFVVNFPMPKPKGAFYIIIPCLAFFLIAFWAVRFLQANGSH